MKSLCNLTATCNEAAKPAEHVATPMQNVQSQKGFWRRLRHSKNLITAESSAGGSVQLSVSELWTLLENHDSKLKTPTP
jgi:hypothetical protein